MANAQNLQLAAPILRPERALTVFTTLVGVGIAVAITAGGNAPAAVNGTGGPAFATNGVTDGNGATGTISWEYPLGTPVPGPGCRG